MVKTRQKKIRNRKKNIVLLTILTLLIFLSGFFFFGLNFFGWHGQTRFTVVFTTRPVMVVSYNPGDSSLTAVSIPSDTYVPTTHGYGLYRLGKVYEVGNLDKKGGEVLKSTVRELLGIPVDGYIVLSQNRFDNSDRLSKQDFLKNRGRILGWQNFFRLIAGKGKTDINFFDLEKFYSRVWQINAGKITFVNLYSVGVLNQKTLPDQSQILAVDNFKLDGVTADLFREDALAGENIKVAVFNSTSFSGLGEKAARIITNMGIQVISVANFGQTLENCLIYTDKNHLQSLTVLKLKKIFGCSIVNPNLSGVRADAALIVGQKYEKELNNK